MACRPLLTGIGAIYVRRRPRVRLEPIISGGGQERSVAAAATDRPCPAYIAGSQAARRLAYRSPTCDHRGFRSGTLAPALVAGLGEAARICKEDMEMDLAHVKRLSKRLVE